MTHDKHVESVIAQYRQRSERGQKKYGVTLERTDLSIIDWINHAQQEAMDLTLYLERIKSEFESIKAAAVAAEREACKKACQAIADDRIAKYQGKAPYTYYNIEHCNESTYGEAEGANACVDAIAARSEKGITNAL